MERVWKNLEEGRDKIKVHYMKIIFLKKNNTKQNPETYFEYVYTCLCVKDMPQCKYSPRTWVSGTQTQARQGLLSTKPPPRSVESIN